MPTHFHLLLKQLKGNGISKFLSLIENSYTRFFNLTHRRKGPLWESRFKSVHIDTDEQLLHLTRYIHLNPTSAKLVNKPEQWKFSSYYEYLERKPSKSDICRFSDIISLNAKQYKEFVEDRISYQQELSLVKKYLLDNYTG